MKKLDFARHGSEAEVESLNHAQNVMSRCIIGHGYFLI